MPIVMSKDEWSRIGRWTNQSKEDPEAARKREYVNFLDATSRAMTKSWPNSLENVNKRNEELRQARLDAAEKTNTNFYKRYVKRKREEQERLMYSARDSVFKNKDAPKLLLSAVIETAIQKERIEQVKFHEEQKRQEKEKKRLEDDEIIRKAKEWEALLELKKKRRFDVNKAHQKNITDQAQEIAERNRIEYETELNLQKIDNIRAEEEIEAINKFDEDFKAAEKKRIWADMERSRIENEERNRERAARDEMDNKLIDVLLRSRARVEQKRKQTEKDVKQEKLRVLEQISQKLESGDAARDAREQAILEKAIKEKEDIAEARRNADLQKKERFKKEKIEIREKFLQDEAQRLHEFNTMRQWDIMNRFKNEEIYDDFKENLRKEKERKIKEYREDILRLWKERDDREARERAETRHFYGKLAEQKLRAADNQLLTHARALVQEARAQGRPPRAIMRTVDQYCKLYRLYPMPELPRSMQEHFKKYAPWDGSSPDAGYTQPPPPPPDLGPDAPDEPEPEPEPAPQPQPAPPGKRDGLQPIDEPGPSKPSDKPQEQPPAEEVDYKRTGRANGLQRQDAQHDIFLPPIHVLPYTTVSSNGSLKQ